MQSLKKFLADERGLESVEFALMGALLVTIVVIGATALMNALSNKFTTIGNSLP